MSDRSFEVVHNIPSPYRLHLFRTLGEELAVRGYRFRVHFMAAGHADRQHWKLSAPDLGFEHRFWPDLPLRVRGKAWHLNPTLLAHLVGSAPDVLMVGGPWDSLTAMLGSAVRRARLRVAWFEGNTSTPGRVAGLPVLFKRALLAGYHRFAVPGREGVAFARLIAGPAAERRSLVLPNIVDEKRFREERPQEAAAVRAELGVRAGERLAIWPARLIRAKGVPEFLSNLHPTYLEGWRLAIIGEGPLERTARQICSERGLSERVVFKPSIPYERMPAAYQAADLFVLPSLNDQNPLSVVEAMHSGLPILVSTRIGNHPEALGDGANGWSFDPADGAAARAAAAAAFGSPEAELRQRGEVSRRKAFEHWNSRSTVTRFLSGLLGERDE
ncbi:MAG: glycosyltransferase family 4 protein [Anaeromyxobacter sp.]